ncbi:hypothetical protein [Pseudoduganella sp. HUAS MS19]
MREDEVAANLDINYAVLCDLIDDLEAGAKKRGDDWKSFTMTYHYGS